MSSTFSAKEPALGYYYQIIRGLVQLLYENRMANPCLSFECLDDIAIEEAGNEESGDVELYQAKLHITPAQMTDRSTDFWKTIRVWSEGIQDGTFNPAVTIFTLITTASISEDSFLKLFFSDKEEDRKKILTTMETIATETTNKSNKPGYEAFSKLTEDQKQGLIANIRISDSNVSIDDTMAQLRYRLELSASTNALESLIDSLVGWWFRNAVDMLQAKSKQTISKATVNNYIQACRDQIRADALPDEFYEKVEIDDVDTVDLADVLIVLAAVDVLRHELRRAEEHALEIGQLRLVLHLYEIQFAPVILGEHIHAVLLVVLILLVALALKQFLYLYLLAEKRGEEALKHSEVGLVAEQPLHCPVKPDILWLSVHNISFLQTYIKLF